MKTALNYDFVISLFPFCLLFSFSTVFWEKRGAIAIMITPVFPFQTLIFGCQSSLFTYLDTFDYLLFCF